MFVNNGGPWRCHLLLHHAHVHLSNVADIMRRIRGIWRPFPNRPCKHFAPSLFESVSHLGSDIGVQQLLSVVSSRTDGDETVLDEPLSVACGDVRTTRYQKKKKKKKKKKKMKQQRQACHSTRCPIHLNAVGAHFKQQDCVST